MNTPAEWRERGRAWGRNALLAFVLVTLGYAWGREVGFRTVRRAAAPAGDFEPVAAVPAAGGGLVRVLYVHGSARCATCIAIERMAREVVERRFADARKAGRVAWGTADFQKDDALARRYGITSSCVVVAELRGGRETRFRRLDEVWEHFDNRPAFERCIADAIAGYLEAPASP